jgi:hypothetical protein
MTGGGLGDGRYRLDACHVYQGSEGMMRKSLEAVFAAILPASMMYISEIMLHQWIYPYTSDFKVYRSLCLPYILIPGILLPSLTAFFFHLHWPKAHNFKTGLLYGLPTLITCFYIYAIFPFTDPNISCSDILDCHFQIMWVIMIFIPLSFFSMAAVAVSSLQGTKKSRTGY